VASKARADETVNALLGRALPPPSRASAPAEPEVDEVPGAKPAAAEAPAEPVGETAAVDETPAKAPPPSDRSRSRPAAPRQATKQAPSEARRPAAEPAPASSARAEQPPLTQSRIPAHMFELVRTAKNSSGDTHEVWFLDAFDAVDDQLEEVYKPAAPRRTRMPPRKRRTRRPTGDPLVSYPLRLTDEEIAVLMERFDELGPPSLADFVTTIVRLRLVQLGMLDVDQPT
jgi:hypothetical protein